MWVKLCITVKLQILVIHTIARDNHTMNDSGRVAPQHAVKVLMPVALVHKRLPEPAEPTDADLVK